MTKTTTSGMDVIKLAHTDQGSSRSSLNGMLPLHGAVVGLPVSYMFRLRDERQREEN